MEYRPTSKGAGDFDTTRGDTIVVDLQVLVPIADGASYVPADITSWLMTATVKRYVSDPDNQAVAQVTSTPTSTPPGGGIVFTQPTNGQAEITIPAFATANLPDGGATALVYDVQVKDGSSRTFTIAQGTIRVSPDVTRATS